MAAHGYAAHRLNACGYSLGATFAPNWMDWPMFYAGQPCVARPGNVFFLHMILFDPDVGLAMTLARTSLVTEAGAEPLSAAPLDDPPLTSSRIAARRPLDRRRRSGILPPGRRSGARGAYPVRWGRSMSFWKLSAHGPARAARRPRRLGRHSPRRSA